MQKREEGRVRMGSPEQVVTPEKSGVQLIENTGFRLSPE